jgi:hypothetical protein
VQERVKRAFFYFWWKNFVEVDRDVWREGEGSSCSMFGDQKLRRWKSKERHGFRKQKSCSGVWFLVVARCLARVKESNL